MKHFATCDSGGFVVSAGSGTGVPEGAIELESPLSVPLLPYGFRYHLESASVMDTRTLDDLKSQQWDKIKQSRATAESSGFTWDGSTFDSDTISQQRITGAVTLAQMSSAFSIDWTLKDNTVRTLSAADMIAVGVALGQHVGAVFAKGQALRAQIEAATTQAEVEAIVW